MNQPGTSVTRSMGGDAHSQSQFKSTVRRGISKTEGPVFNEKGFLYDLQQGISNQSLGASVFGSGHSCVIDMGVQDAPTEMTAADMSLSTLYLHELHHRQVSDHPRLIFLQSFAQTTCERHRDRDRERERIVNKLKRNPSIESDTSKIKFYLCFSGKEKRLSGDGNEEYMAAKSDSGVGHASGGQARASTALAASRLLFKEN